MVRPVKPFLKLFRGHPAGLKHHMFSVVLGPISVEDASGIVVPVEERRSWQRREHVEVGELDLFYVRKSTARSNTDSSSLSNPKTMPGFTMMPWL